MTVADIQRALIRHGFDPRGIDGIMGKNTIAALEAFQALRGLQQSGIADAKTVAALQAQPPAAAKSEVGTIKPAIALAPRYAFLLQEAATLPLLAEALRLHGVKEKVGPGSNPAILAWAAECGLGGIYKDDATPWCGLFAAVVAKRAGQAPVKDPLWALNWRNFGRKVDAPMLGDIMAFTRPSGGHVGIYVGEDATHVHCLGGNQGDAVSVIRIEKARLRGAAMPIWPTGVAPANRRKVMLSAKGSVSTNEA